LFNRVNVRSFKATFLRKIRYQNTIFRLAFFFRKADAKVRLFRGLTKQKSNYFSKKTVRLDFSDLANKNYQ